MAEGFGLNQAVQNYFLAKQSKQKQSQDAGAAALAKEKHDLEMKKLKGETEAADEERRAKMAYLMQYANEGQQQAPQQGAAVLAPQTQQAMAPQGQAFDPSQFNSDVRVEAMARQPQAQPWQPGPFDVNSQGPGALARPQRPQQQSGDPIVDAMAKALGRKTGDKQTLSQIDSDMAGFAQAENALRKISIDARNIKENLEAYKLAIQNNPENADELQKAIDTLEAQALRLQRERDAKMKQVMDFKTNMIKLAIQEGRVDPELFRQIAVMMQEDQKIIGSPQNPENRAQMLYKLRQRYKPPDAGRMPAFFK